MKRVILGKYSLSMQFTEILTAPTQSMAWQRIVDFPRRVAELGGDKETPNMDVSLDNADGKLTQFIVQMMGCSAIVYENETEIFKGETTQIKSGRILTLTLEAGNGTQ